MKKMILFSPVALSIPAWAQQVSPETTALKVFMQPDNHHGSAIQYGNNPQSGHYVQSDDARIYYEAYGMGKHCTFLEIKQTYQ